jgi:biopolymer transport protein TolR
MGMDAGGKPGGVKSDINVTPLVDVMLVLLIIFMLIAPQLQTGQAVKLPVAANPVKQAEDKSQIMVVLQAERQGGGYAVKDIFVDKDRVTEAQFRDKIKEAFDRNPSGKVAIKADAHLSYGDVKKFMEMMNRAGFKGVGLVAKKQG